MMTRKEQLKKIFQIINNYCSFWVLVVGLQKNLFSALDAPSAIVRKKNIKRTFVNQEFVNAWLFAAYSCGIVGYSAKKGLFLLPYIRELLIDKESKHYVGNIIMMYAELSRLYISALDTKEAGRKGSIPFYKTLITAMGEVTRKDVQILFSHIQERYPSVMRHLHKAKTFLSLGVGVGFEAIYLAQRFPFGKIIAVDNNKYIIQIARKNIRQARLSRRISLRLMDAKKIEEKEKYDFICMNLSLHEICSHKKNRDILLKKCYRALKKNGIIIINEHSFSCRPEDYAKPYSSMLLGFQIPESLFGHDMLYSQELHKLLMRKKWRAVRRIPQEDPTRVLFMAKK